MNYFLSLILLFVFMTGCSKENKTYQYVVIPHTAIEQTGSNTYAPLLERFSDYWEASSLNDFEETYAYELPYLNFLKSLDWYLDFKRSAKRRYKVTLLTLTPDSNDADIVYMRLNFKGKQLDSNISEKWIKINGTWYHDYAQSILPPKPPKVH